MKAIVTTTINPMTEALKKYVAIARRDNWKMYVVGDLKTPHDEYEAWMKKNPGVFVYLLPSLQMEKYPKLSELIGWNCIQRRNIGFVEAIRDGAEVIATIDDDNIPLDNWGQNIKVNKLVEVDVWTSEDPVIDPLYIAPSNFEARVWHRGFPLQYRHDHQDYVKTGTQTIKPLVQANLWNGNPDVDAICRLSYDLPDFEFHVSAPFTADKPMPFNSQNTILSSDVFPEYFLFPHIGRMDDIWAAYWIQQEKKGLTVIFDEPTVFQKRNPHDLVKDLEQEVIGYRHSWKLVSSGFSAVYLPIKSWEAFTEYKRVCKKPKHKSLPLGF